MKWQIICFILGVLLVGIFWYHYGWFGGYENYMNHMAKLEMRLDSK